jgi:hypothetical protein
LHNNIKLDIIFSLTPADNRRALKFLKKNGMTIVSKFLELISHGEESKNDVILSLICRNEKKQ